MAKTKTSTPYEPQTMKFAKQRHNSRGEEILDPTPMQPPLGYRRAPTLAEQIRQQVLAAKIEALDELKETEEEADDFNIDDDFEPFSPHENDGMPSIKELKKRATEIQNQIKQRNLSKLREQLEIEIENKRGGSAAPLPTTSSTVKPEK